MSVEEIMFTCKTGPWETPKSNSPLFPIGIHQCVGTGWVKINFNVFKRELLLLLIGIFDDANCAHATLHYFSPYRGVPHDIRMFYITVSHGSNECNTEKQNVKYIVTSSLKILHFLTVIGWCIWK